MRYMLMMFGEESADGGVPGPAQPPGEENEPCWLPWAREMQARGVILSDGAQLQPSGTATMVRSEADEAMLSDGPFAETKEQILGYNVIECADLDEAIYAASRHPVALSGGVVEVRPIRAS